MLFRSNVLPLALEHFDWMLVRGRWLGTAHSGDNQGCSGSMNSRPFRSYRPRFAFKASSRPDSKRTQLKTMYHPWLSSTLIECLRVIGGLGGPTVAIIRAFADLWIPGHIGQIVLGSDARQAQDLIQRCPSTNNCISLCSRAL